MMTQPVAPTTTPRAHGPSLSALVVDDDPFIRDVLAECLRRQDIAVIEAGDGVECLEVLEQNTFDVIFMDIVMPEKDGIETIIALRKRGITTKVIVISSHTKIGDLLLIDAAKSVGADDFIKKPFNAEALAKSIKALLSAKRMNAAG